MTESEVDKCLRLATNTLFNSVCRISLASHVFDTKRSQVQFMTDTEVEVFPPSPAPSSDDYVGCYNDMVGDRLLTTVDTYDALTPAVSVTSRATSWQLPYIYIHICRPLLLSFSVRMDAPIGEAPGVIFPRKPPHWSSIPSTQD